MFEAPDPGRLQMMGDTGMLYPDEVRDTRKVLTAAALTYVAGAAAAILQLLRLPERLLTVEYLLKVERIFADAIIETATPASTSIYVGSKYIGGVRSRGRSFWLGFL